MNKQNTRERIGEIIGEASMCWSETPTGIFQSDKAITLIDKLEAIASQSRQQERMEMAEEIEKALPKPIEKYRGFPLEADEKAVNETLRRVSTIINNLKVK